jgi:glycosyltransferase involved in cell wall biosynthesis
MRIVIDMQGAQTESRFRGIGRYSLSLAKAIVRNRGEHEIILALNGLFPETIEPIRAAFDDILPQGNIRVWYAPGPVRECEHDNEWRREVAERIREAFLANLKPDVIILCSLFEGFGDDAVTSIGVFDTDTPVAVILYDLIPLISPDDNFKNNKLYNNYYSRKIDSLKKAWKLLAISDSARHEVIDVLGIDENKIVNISAACDFIFRRLELSKSEKIKFCSKMGIVRPFVMYTGGADERKNLHRLIQAYALLPTNIRKSHQLVLVGKMPEGNINDLMLTAKKNRLVNDEVVITGYVDDEDLVKLYNCCELFVFPSLHEGFGIPPLEAMLCGAPVIGANVSSLPEIIGWDEALFDPHDARSIFQKINKVLTDESFRRKLIRHEAEQPKKFSWDESARRAVQAIEKIALAKDDKQKNLGSLIPKLIQTISNLVPINIPDREILNIARSMNYIHTSVISKQLFVDVSELVQRDSKSGIQRVTRSILKEFIENPPEGYMVRPVYATTNTHGYYYARKFTAQFSGLTADQCDEIIDYHFGDIFLGLHLQHHVVMAQKDYLAELRHDGVKVFFVVYDLLPVLMPKSFHSHINIAHEIWLKTLYNYDGVICISRAVADELTEWYHNYGLQSLHPFKISWFHLGADVDNSVPTFGLPDNAHHIFKKLVCRPTFLTVGTIEPRKGQEQTLGAFELLWKQGVDANFVIVGKQGWMVESLVKCLHNHPELDKRLFWLEGISDEYLEKIYSVSTCLIAASKGEGFGLPLIEAARHKIPIIARDIPIFHEVAGELAYYFSGENSADLADTISQWIELFNNGKHPKSDNLPWLTWRESANILKEKLIKNTFMHRQIFVDISELVQRDSKSGIQRVTRSILKELLENPPEGYIVEPVYATVDTIGYHYARKYVARIFNKTNCKNDEPIDYRSGDIFLGLDLQYQIVLFQKDYLAALRRDGVKVFFIVHDLLPILMPNAFHPQVGIVYEAWLRVVSSLDGAVCVSQIVAKELRDWCNDQGLRRLRPFKIGWFHHGADIENSVPSRGLPDNAEYIINSLATRPTFLTVGTLEPRKGQMQILNAFEILWRQAIDVNLVIVGKQGWLVETLIKRIRQHPELNKHLFWLEGISDEYLEKIYSVSICLIAASKGEGFGLPLIEAARHKIPIIARDIPVFREVAGEHAFYFDGLEPSDLSVAINNWLKLNAKGKAPQSVNMPWQTWKQSTQQLLENILPKVGGNSSKETHQASIYIKDKNKEVVFKKYRRGSYFRKLINTCIIIALRSRFKKPLKKIYYALRLNKIKL